MHKNKTFLTLATLVGAALQAHAATPPGIGEVLQQTNPVARPPAKTPPPPVEGLPAIEPPLQSLPGDQATVEVQGFRFSGNAIYDDAALQAVAADAVGKRLTVAQLHAVATRVTRLYREAGYFVARAYVPAQELVGGVVTVRVVEGHYGDFLLDHHGRLRQETAQAILDAVKERDIVSVDTLERAMLILNDTPGVHVEQVSVSPGERVGTSDFHVATVATPAFVGVAALDNYGSVYTGRTRLSFNGSWDAPTQTGDRLDLYAMTTEHGGLDSGRLGYWHLLSPTGLRGEVALARTTYELGDTYAALDAVGHADSIEALLTYPLVLTETHRLTASVGAAYNDLVDEVRSTGTRTPKKVGLVNAGLEYASTAADAAMQAGAGLSVGRLGIHDATADAADAAGANTRGSFGKLAAHLERRQALGEFELALRLRGQTSLGKSLDGSQKLEVSGSDGVLVYAPGELLGDDAAVGRMAVSRPFDVGGVRIAPGAFIDFGWAHNRHPSAGTAGERSLGDAGIGVTGSYKAVTLSLQWANRIEGGAAVAEPTSSSRVLAQLSAAF